MLRLEHLHAGYRHQSVLADLSLHCLPQTITAIVGPNGSGKSTLLKAIAGLCEVFSGSIAVEGTSKAHMTSKEFARQVSYLPQIHQGGAISVWRMVLHGRFPHLGYPRRYQKADFEHARRALEQVGIYELRDRNVEELSGGQRQKVFLAMALATDAKILLLDEPTTYLDLRHQLEFMEVLKRLKEENKSIVVVLHDIRHAMDIAQQMVVIDQGKAVFQGSVAAFEESEVLHDVFHIAKREVFDQEQNRYLQFALAKKEDKK